MGWSSARTIVVFTIAMCRRRISSSSARRWEQGLERNPPPQHRRPFEWGACFAQTAPAGPLAGCERGEAAGAEEEAPRAGIVRWVELTVEPTRGIGPRRRDAAAVAFTGDTLHGTHSHRSTIRT